MAKKKAAATKAPAHELDIPAVLKRNGDNVSPATAGPAPELKAESAVVVRPRFDKPRGMTDAEYDAAKAKYDPASPKKEAKKKEFFEKKEKKAKVEAPKGTFQLRVWAVEAKLDPRAVRRVARSIKGELSKMYVGGMKYVFKDADKAAVAKLIHDGFASETKRKVTVKKPKLPPPSLRNIGPGGVWSGKAKKAKPGPASVDPKAEARAQAEKAIVKTAKEIKARKTPRAKK